MIVTFSEGANVMRKNQIDVRLLRTELRLPNSSIRDDYERERTKYFERDVKGGKDSKRTKERTKERAVKADMSMKHADHDQVSHHSSPLKLVPFRPQKRAWLESCWHKPRVVIQYLGQDRNRWAYNEGHFNFRPPTATEATKKPAERIWKNQPNSAGWENQRNWMEKVEPAELK